MTPVSQATAIIDPWYSGPVTSQTLQSLTAATSALCQVSPPIWAVALLGAMTALIIVGAVVWLTGRRA